MGRGARLRTRPDGSAVAMQLEQSELPFPVSTVIDSLERSQLRRVPSFDAGDRLRVHFQVIEGTLRRVQVFEGVVIKRQGEGVRETFTVRKNSFGVGVERTFPVHTPKIERIEVAARGDVRRAKLYYLRELRGKKARIKERRLSDEELAALAAAEAARAAGTNGEAPDEADADDDTVETDVETSDADSDARGETEAQEAEVNAASDGEGASEATETEG